MLFKLLPLHHKEVLVLLRALQGPHHVMANQLAWGEFAPLGRVPPKASVRADALRGTRDQPHAAATANDNKKQHGGDTGPQRGGSTLPCPRDLHVREAPEQTFQELGDLNPGYAEWANGKDPSPSLPMETDEATELLLRDTFALLSFGPSSLAHSPLSLDTCMRDDHARPGNEASKQARQKGRGRQAGEPAR